MMIFVKSLTVSTITLDVDLSDSLATVCKKIQDREFVSCEYWRLVYGGKQLADDKTLHQCGIEKDATLHLVGRLLGGKGGFGSLLRGAGRAILTDNVDACRDLSGRRLRQANAEKRLTEWAAEARERELEKVALKHVKEQQKATQKEQRAQVDSEAVRREQQEALDRVSAAVIAAQEILAGGTLETGKRKAGLQSQPKATKRARIYGFEELSDSDSDNDSEFEAAARLAKAGQVAATASSGDDSEASAQETALAVASGVPSTSAHDAAHTSTAQPTSHAPAQTGPGQPSTASSAHSRDQKPFSPLSAVDTRSYMPSPTQSAAPTEQLQEAAAPPVPDATAQPDDKKPVKMGAAADQAAPSEAGGTAEAAPVNLADFGSATELEAVGMPRLKAELQRHGLKCGGSSSERAARLFLLKNTAVDKLDQQHFSKPARTTQSKKA